jgi:transcription elongation factor Elf1
MPETQPEPNMAAIELKSTLTCPHCGHAKTETMPTDACQWFYEWEGCKAILKPKAGDCCVYCSYCDVPCPPIQESGAKGCCG